MKNSKNQSIFIKLGGSLITKKKPHTADLKKIREIAKEIHKARKEKDFRLLIGNGGGSYPHIPAQKYKTAGGIINERSLKGIAEVQDAASKLNRIIVRALVDAGENAISVQPSSVCLTKNFRIVEFYTKPLEMFLEKNMVPVVYGDVGLDLEQGCSIMSTEELFVFLAKKLKPEKIILMAKVDGVYDEKGEVIPQINKNNFPGIKKVLKGADKVDVTGGMLHKVTEAIKMAREGIEVNIIGGKRGNLEKCLKGKRVGTQIKNF